MGNQTSGVSSEDFRAMETSGRHLGDAKDPQVKKMSKRLEAMKQQVFTGTPPDIRALFDQLAVDGKISRANFAILLRGSLNFAVKNAVASAAAGGAPQPKASKKESIAEIQALAKAAVPSDAPGGGATATAIAVAVKAVDRVDLHATSILDRVFVFLDQDNSGFLEFNELETFMQSVMTDPQSVLDPFKFIGGGAADKITVDQFCSLVDDVFKFLADMMIQSIDIIEDVTCSAEVARSLEVDGELWSRFFGVAGGDKSISKKQFKAFLAQAPWEEINAGFTAQMNNPAQKANWSLLTSQFEEMRETILSSISETGDVQEGLARAYAWLRNGVDETTFMTSLLPAMRKYTAEKTEPKALAKSTGDSIKVLIAQVKDSMEQVGGAENLPPQMAMALPLLQTVQAKVDEEGFLEGVFKDPEVFAVVEAYSAAVQEKLPIMLHHIFRFCDINSDGGVSESELKVLFALKDALVHGKLDEAAVHIFEVIDQDGNNELSPGELIAFFSKGIHLYAALLRIYASLFFETLLPKVVQAVLKKVAAAIGKDHVTKEEVPQLMQMGSMAMMQFGMQAQMAAQQAAMADA